jgi:hypothetical protein
LASATITLQSVCAGGDHVTLRLTVGAQTFDFHYGIDELRENISTDDRREAVRTITRFHCGGMTKAQAKAELQGTGISVATS